MNILKKHPMSSCYALMGGLSLILGVLTINGFIESKEDLTVTEVFGLAIMILSAFLILAAYLIFRMELIEAQLRKNEREELLQDLQQEK